MSTETISIGHCPLCGRAHSYGLSVDRSFIMKMMTAASIEEEPTYRRFTRFFTCPTKNAEFQATIKLAETSDDRIKDVQVVGPSDRR